MLACLEYMFHCVLRSSILLIGHHFLDASVDFSLSHAPLVYVRALKGCNYFIFVESSSAVSASLHIFYACIMVAQNSLLVMSFDEQSLLLKVEVVT